MNWVERLAQIISDAVTNTLGPIASFLEGYVWGWPAQAPLLAVVLLGTGLFVPLRLMFVQIRGFKHAIDITRGRYDKPGDEGDLKHYQALTTALSATVGIGNIAGVAIAIRMGGPGALFWMWLSAFFGMALKFSECTLALRYRKVNPDGSVSGGPMYYMEKALAPRWAGWKAIALFFAACTIISSLCAGNMNQSNTMAIQVQDKFGVEPVWTSLIFAVLVGTVILGGIQRIGKVTSVLAPAMAILYVGGALIVIALDWHRIPEGLSLIVSQAFAPEPMIGGGVASFLLTMMWGVRRGLFSNEAGQGSAPIAHAAAKTDEPVREGLVATLEPFIDTLVICTMTGLVIVFSGAWLERVEQPLSIASMEAVVAEAATDAQLQDLRAARTADVTVPVVAGRPQGATLVYLDATVEEPLFTAGGQPWNGELAISASGSINPVGDGAASVNLDGKALLTGSPLTARGFSAALGPTGAWIVTLAVVLFAVSTAISWSYYGDRATEYLFGGRAVHFYRLVFVGFFFLGGILPLQAVWTIGDVALGLMSFPNLIALILLSGTLVAMTRAYFSKEHKPYK